MAPTNGDQVVETPPTQHEVNETLKEGIDHVNNTLIARIALLEGTLQQMELRGKPRGGHPPVWGKNEEKDTTWSSFLSRFEAWCTSEDVMRDPIQCKSYLYQSIMGSAANCIVAIKPGTAFYDNSTFREYADKLDLIFRPASDAAVAKAAYEDRSQGEGESVQTFFCQKKNLYCLAFTEDDPETSTRLIDDTIKGLTNKGVVKHILANRPYTSFERCLSVAQMGVAMQRQLNSMGFENLTKGLACSGPVRKNLAEYAAYQGGKGGGEPMDIGAVVETNDDDLIDLEMTDLLAAATTTGGFTGSCYKCGKPGHMIRNCNMPVGWRRTPRGRPWNSQWNARGRRGQARGGPRRDRRGRFRPTVAAAAEYEEGEEVPVDQEAEIGEIETENDAGDEPAGFPSRE